MVNAPPTRVGAHLELRVETIAAGGDGIARAPDGRVVFVPRTLPGERVRATVVTQRRDWARARLDAVLEAAPGRRATPCPLAQRCGGCPLQHAAETLQREIKARIVTEAFARGGLAAPPPDGVVDSPRPFGYRNRIRLELRRDGDRVTLGYHAADDPETLVDVDDCPLAEPAIRDALARLRAAWGPAAVRLPAGRRLQVTLRATQDGDVGLEVRGARGAGQPAALLEAVAPLAAVDVFDARGKRHWHAGARELRERLGTLAVGLRPGVFVQVNRHAAARLETWVREAIGPVDGRRVLDLYCGVGVRAVALARAGATVDGVDADAGAIASANAVAAGHAGRPRLHAARVEDVVDRLLPADVVVVNPPRAGLAAPVRRALVTVPPRRLVYVSCDPATLTRDLRELADVFDIRRVRAFDLFPQTAHVETGVLLVRP